MSIRRSVTLAVTAAVLLTTLAAPSATAQATGRVVAFVGDLLPVRVWENPSGCNRLPLGTHVLFNETDRVIEAFADPWCLIPLEPLAQLAPGTSMHVSSVGAFRA
ncbi:hypothetical protein [Actinophytocola sediminis]